ncbi:MAG: hypothetical protein PHF57_11265 [Methanoregula sp.]|nr:hypothetical protein [Methanoregula sp.]MDD5188774.1 hypothetical protein [Methanoregula sp.]
MRSPEDKRIGILPESRYDPGRAGGNRGETGTGIRDRVTDPTRQRGHDRDRSVTFAVRQPYA